MTMGRGFAGGYIPAALAGIMTIAPAQAFRANRLCGPAVGARADLQRPEAKSPRPQTPARLWKIEIEGRDDPSSVTAEFDLDKTEPTALFKTAQGSFRTERGAWAGSKFVFHLPDDPLYGAADGEAEIAPEAVHGVLFTSKGELKFHGRPQKPTDLAVRSVPASLRQGPGFRRLTLERDGKPWTLPDRMRFHHVPAVSLARIENYKVVEIGAFGVTDIESGTPVDTDTLFQAGGMGSPLLNLLALRLAAQGRLDLDRDVNASLKSAPIADNAFTHTRKTTVRDLMNGASGLSQYKFGGYRPGIPLPTLPALLAGKDPKEMEPLQPVRVPGTYGGEGVCGALLQQVIEEATGRSLPELMRKNIFAPLGMNHSTYAFYPAENLRGKITLGHYATGGVALDRFHLYPETGETGLWTTAGDFARMLCQVQLLLAGKPNRILSAEQTGLLKPFLTERCILGFLQAEKGDFLPVGYLYHGGASYGYYANHATHRSNGTGIVVMENRNLSWALNNEIIKAVLKSHPAAP